MATAGDLLAAKKGGGVITVEPDCTVLDACRVLRDRNIGAVVVRDAKAFRGIFTERDVVKRVVSEGLDPATTKVSQVMTPKVIVVRPDRSIEEIEAIMKQERVRHVPVAGDAGIIGIVSIGDVTAFHADEDHQKVEYLTEYLYGKS
jgi:CBS domain-containing protein